MKKFYSTLFLFAITLASFSQTYKIYTAKRSGLWSDNGNWNVITRVDGVAKNRYVVPNAYTMIVDNAINDAALGDVEIVVSGGLLFVGNSTLALTNNSSLQLNSGLILGLASDQVITIGGVVKYQGNKDYFKIGSLIADKTTGASPAGFKAFASLPVNFTSFYIGKSGQDVQLTWSTDKEINNSHFDVERSFNGTDWQKLSVIDGAGTSTNVNNYSYNDKNVSGSVVYYRLRQVDIDGGFVYSSIKSIRMSEAVSAVRIYGANKNVVIDLNTSIKNSLVITIINTGGQVISKQTVRNPSYRINVNMPNASNGTYIVHVTDSKGWTEVRKVNL